MNSTDSIDRVLKRLIRKVSTYTSSKGKGKMPMRMPSSSSVGDAWNFLDLLHYSSNDGE
jgi:hypothetical protein